MDHDKVKWRFTRKQYLRFGRALYVVGGVEELGNWNPSNSVRLTWSEGDNWSAEVALPFDKLIEYKFIEGGFNNIHEDMWWESGDNRKLNLSQILHTRDQLSIMSFNIRYDNKDDGVNRWDHRKQPLCKALLGWFPCIVGIQQAKPHQRAFIQQYLKEYYGYVGIPRDLKQDEEVGILYLMHKFFVIDSGFVWFNEARKPGVPGYGCVLPRNLTYAILEDQQVHEKSLVINLHLDHACEEAQKASIQILLETIDNILAEDKKFRKKPIQSIFIVGDFNIPDTSPYLDILYKSKYNFKVARQLAEDPQVTTFHGWKGKEWTPAMQIDHVIYSSNRKLSKFRVLTSEAPYLSDHFPIEALFAKE